MKEGQVAEQDQKDQKDQKPAEANGKQREAKPRESTIPYLVFQAGGPTLKDGEQVTFLGRHIAPDKQQARWAAVDANGLNEAAKVPAGSTEGGLYLIAIAERMATPERTAEEQIVQTVRR